MPLPPWLHPTTGDNRGPRSARELGLTNSGPGKLDLQSLKLPSRFWSSTADKTEKEAIDERSHARFVRLARSGLFPLNDAALRICSQSANDGFK